MGRIERLDDLDLDRIQAGDPDELAALLALLHPIITMRVEDAVEDLARGFREEWDTALEFLDQPSAVHLAVRIVFSNLHPRYFKNEVTFYRFVETVTTAAVLHEFRELLLKKHGIDGAVAFPGGGSGFEVPRVLDQIHDFHPLSNGPVPADSVEETGRR